MYFNVCIYQNILQTCLNSNGNIDVCCSTAQTGGNVGNNLQPPRNQQQTVQEPAPVAEYVSQNSCTILADFLYFRSGASEASRATIYENA